MINVCYTKDYELCADLDELIEDSQVWTKNDWAIRSKNPDTSIIVAKDGMFVIGALVIYKATLLTRIDRIVVHPVHQREGLGTLMFNKVPFVNHFKTIVPERNLAVQLFLRSLGFRCTKIIETNYVFERKQDEFGQIQTMRRSQSLVENTRNT